MKTTKILLVAIIALVLFILGQIAQKQTDEAVQKERVFKYFGEGDIGEEILYYLEKGKEQQKNKK